MSPASDGAEASAMRVSHVVAPPIQRWLRPLSRFLQIEAAGGVVLLAATAIALAVANSGWGPAFERFWGTPLSLTVGLWRVEEPLRFLVNDALMTIFFFVVGLEIKRELVDGELRDPRKAALPVIAALGGMVTPAVVFLLLCAGRPGQSGWGVPMATDIAFVAGFLALLGRRVPAGLKIMLLSLAIVDDIGAVIVIAIVYSTDLSGPALAVAALGLLAVVLGNRIGVRSVAVYVALGAVVWLGFLRSGVHPTVAGVVLGLLTPSAARISRPALLEASRAILERLRDPVPLAPGEDRRALLGQLETVSREAASPLARLESALHPWVSFVIMPAFALANAGVSLRGAALGERVALAVAGGLVIGKPLGIYLFCRAAVGLGLARLPAGVNWRVMLGAGGLAGIGFTMSLFVAGLALKGELLEAGKVGTLGGSLLSAAAGSLMLATFLPRPPRAAAG